jgi:trehalose synthase
VLVDGVEDCARGILRFLRDPAAARALARTGRERVRERFLLPRLLRDELALIRDVLREGPSGRESLGEGCAATRSAERRPRRGLAASGVAR